MSAMYVGLLVVVFILLSGRIALVNRELEQKKMELQRYSAQLSQVATLRNAISNLEEKLNFKSKVVEANNKWIALLDLIRLHTPKDVWITAIDIAPPDGFTGIQLLINHCSYLVHKHGLPDLQLRDTLYGAFSRHYLCFLFLYFIFNLCYFSELRLAYTQEESNTDKKK
jgi:hypothetical protein